MLPPLQSDRLIKQLTPYFTRHQWSMTPVINVTGPDFGAKGDGTTSDKVAVQKAITAAKNAGGGVVYFPAGTYLLTASSANETVLDITGDAPIVLIGAGKELTILKFDNNTLAYYGLYKDSTSTLHVQDLTLRGPNPASSSSTTGFVVSSDEGDVTLERVSIGELWRNGFEINSPTDAGNYRARFIECDFYADRFGGSGSAPNDSTVKIEFINCVWKGIVSSTGTHHLFYGKSSMSVRAVGCDFYNCPGGIALAMHGTPSTPAEYFQIDDCYFDATVNRGIETNSNGPLTTISNCRFTTIGAALMIRDSTTVTGCIFDGATGGASIQISGSTLQTAAGLVRLQGCEFLNGAGIGPEGENTRWEILHNTLKGAGSISVQVAYDNITVRIGHNTFIGDGTNEATRLFGGQVIVSDNFFYGTFNGGAVKLSVNAANAPNTRVNLHDNFFLLDSGTPLGITTDGSGGKLFGHDNYFSTDITGWSSTRYGRLELRHALQVTVIATITANVLTLDENHNKFRVNNSGTVNTIELSSSTASKYAFSTEVTLIADAAFTLADGAGNIQTKTGANYVATVGEAVRLVYDPVTDDWFQT